MRPSLLATLLAAALLAVAALLLWQRGDDPAPLPIDPVAAADRGAPVAPDTSGDPTAAVDTDGPVARRAAPAAEPGAGTAGAATADARPRITGRVLDPTGAPVEGARVFAERRPTSTGAVRLTGFERLQRRLGDGVRTDADGRFALARDAAGAATLIAIHPEWRDGRVETAFPTAELLIRLEAGATITGRIVGVPDPDIALRVACRRIAADTAPDRDSGNPLAGLLRFDVADLSGDLGAARGDRDAAVTADAGFELRGLAPDGEYELWAFEQAAPEAAHRVDPTAVRVRTERVRVLAGARGVALAWRDGLVLKLSVVAPGGAPLETLRVTAGLENQVELFGARVSAVSSSLLPQREFPGGHVVIHTLQVDGPTGVALVEIEAEGYRPFVREAIEVPQSGVVDLGRIELEPASGVAVTVRDAADGAPIAGATVRVFAAPDDPRAREGGGGIRVLRAGDAGGPMNVATATTDAGGRAVVRSTAVARAVVAVDAEGRAPSWTAVAVGGRLVEHTVTLDVGGSVAVTLVDPSGTPVVRRAVEHRDDTAHRELRAADALGSTEPIRTDATGTAVFRDLPPGEHRFAPAARERPPGGRGLVFHTGEDREWTATTVVAAVESQLRIEVLATGTLRGTVTLDGQPLVEATVRLLRRGGDSPQQMVAVLLGGSADAGAVAAATTDAAGRFALTDVEHGDYRVTVRHRDLAMPTRRDTTVAGLEQTTDIEIRDTVLSGRVVDEVGRPLADAKVSVRGERVGEITIVFAGMAPPHDGVRSAADGSFALRGIAAGDPLTIEAHHDGRLAATRRVDDLAPGERRALDDLVLSPAGGLDVHCALATATRIALVQLDADGAAVDGTARSEPLDSGTARFRQLAPGRYRASVEGAEGSLGDARVVTIQAGPPLRLDW